MAALAMMTDDQILAEFRAADPLLEGHFILSSREAVAAVEKSGGKVVGAASLVDRSGGSADLGVPYTALIRIDVPTYAADAVPPELAAIPAVKPGSRAAA